MTFITKAGRELNFGRTVNHDGFTGDQIRKWMSFAKNVQEKPEGCLSRQIGCVIVDPHTHSLVSAGHNGPPDGAELCDSEHYLRSVVWPQLTSEEKKRAGDEDQFAKHTGCGECPRRIVGCPSGQRLELCSCVHGETNAIVRAHRSVKGMWIFCWCSVPCIDCTKLIINSKLECVVALDNNPDDTIGAKDYSPFASRWLYKQTKTNLLLVTPEWLSV